MAKGFFRERKHYKLWDIAENLEETIEETKRLVGILKRCGIVKAVKTSKTEYTELSNQDIVLSDVTENSGDMEYVFDFVGVVMLEEQVFKCYPKYILSTSEPMQQLKQVLKVIQACNKKEQLVYLYNGEEDHQLFNRLAVSLYLLEDYFQYGVYTNQHETVETNGEGEILWDQTIHDTFALILNNKPYYVEFQNCNRVDDETDYIKRLHECVLSRCSAELKAAGLLELFDIAEIEMTDVSLEEFGDTDYIRYRIERELQTQFITRKQRLLKTIYTYIAGENAGREDISFSLYGTNSFNLVWEKVCAHNFGNMLEARLDHLPIEICPEYAAQKEKTLKDFIAAPVWHKNNPPLVSGKVKTLRPDMICIYPMMNGYCFGIFDAKYYDIHFEQQEQGWKVIGQPGVEDIVKQYIYQLAYDDFIEKQGFEHVRNVFLCPREKAEPDYGYVEMSMLHEIGGKSLQNIAVVMLCAEDMYERYLSGRIIEDVTEYISG